MKLLIGYATSEGQTRRIARHVCDHLVDRGHSVELAPLSEAGGIDLGRFDRSILAASIHGGRYQEPLTDFVAEQAGALARMPTLFLSVSLSAAGHDAEDWKGLDRILADFVDASGWTPGRVEQVAGAYRPSEYDLFRRFIMRRIIAEKDPDADLDADREYTDWTALDRAVEEWLAG